MPDIPEDSTAAVTAANLLGSKFIDITKGQSATPVKPGGELRSLQTQDIPELMAQSANLITTLQDISKRADSMLADIDAGKGNLGKLLRDDELYKRLNAIAAEGQQLLADVRNGKGTLSKLIYDDSLYQEVRAPIKRIDAMLADLQQGQGSAGKLLKDPQVYDEAQQTLAEMRQPDAGSERRQGHRRQAAEGRATLQAVHRPDRQAGYHHRPDQLRAGHGRAVARESADVRRHERRHARVPGAGQGHPRQSQEIPAHQAGNLLISRKRLVVNADDFGFTPDVNRGIVEAHREGILTATTLMANGEAFDDAVRLARETPSLDVGCHLVLISGRSLLPPYAPLPASAPQLLRALAVARAFACTTNWPRRCARSWRPACAPTHLDTHKHTHLAPPVLDAVARLAEEFGIRWVRRPFDIPLTGQRGGARGSREC